MNTHIIKTTFSIGVVVFGLAMVSATSSLAQKLISPDVYSIDSSNTSASLSRINKNNLQPITRQLIDFLKENPEYISYLDDSLKQAARINPDRHTNPAQTMQEYILYVDEASRLIPQQILQNPSSIIRDQILQSICYFYFLIDQPIDALKTKQIYKNTLQYDPAFSIWTRNFADAWGDFLDTPESFNDKTYQQFLKDPKFRLATGDYESRSNWNTFNRFFSRYLSSPSVRPIAMPGSPDIVVSPADSVPQGVWDIDASSNIVVDDSSQGFRIKNTRYFNVNELLGPELSQFYGDFANGTLTHTFLNVFDYHRYHFPVGGQIIAKSSIQQNVALEVTYDPANSKYVPVDSTGWQFTQTRGIVIVQTEKYGKVAVIPMGMAHVSSVNFEDYVVPGNTVNKGDMLGTFLFGGSDYIFLFQEEAGFVIQAPQNDPNVSSLLSRSIEESRPSYKHILMGERYGQMTSK